MRIMTMYDYGDDGGEKVTMRMLMIYYDLYNPPNLAT